MIQYQIQTIKILCFLLGFIDDLGGGMYPA